MCRHNRLDQLTGCVVSVAWRLCAEKTLFFYLPLHIFFLAASLRSPNRGGRRWKRQRCQWQLCDANSSCGVNMPESRSVNKSDKRQETSTLKKMTRTAQEASSDAVVKASEILWVSGMTSRWHHSMTGLNCALWDHSNIWTLKRMNEMTFPTFKLLYASKYTHIS